MRFLGVVAMLALAAPAMASPKSDPAFLGVGMDNSSGPCRITSVVPGSGAYAAGLRTNDTILAINRTRIESCQPQANVTGANLLDTVASFDRGDWVTMDVLDLQGQPRVLKVQLPSRGEIMQRRLAGKRLDRVDLVTAADPTKRFELDDLRDRSAIVGWFKPGCSDCAYVFGKLASRTADHTGKPATLSLAISTLASTKPEQRAADAQRLQKAIAVPLALADQETFDDVTITDDTRIVFMVLDCRGLVQYVVPIAPSSDDVDAALDELYAAADQARMSR
jgi:hypothetical protein